MSALSNFFSSFYLYIIAGLFSVVLFLGWFSVHQTQALGEVKQSLSTALDANTTLQKSLELKDLSCKIDDKITTEYQEEKSSNETQTQVEQSAIDKLPSIAPIKPTKAGVNNVTPTQNPTVNIDNALPDSLRELLLQTCNRAKGSACINP